MPEASLRRSCRVLDVTRATLYGAEAEEVPGNATEAASQPSQDELLVARIKLLIEEFPTYGYRRICALLRKRDKLTINRKKVYRLMREQRWMISQHETSPKPRVQKSRSRTEQSNERWAMVQQRATTLGAGLPEPPRVSHDGEAAGVRPAKPGLASGEGRTRTDDLAARKPAAEPRLASVR